MLAGRRRNKARGWELSQSEEVMKTVSCGEGQQGAVPDIGYLTHSSAMTHTTLLCLYLK